MRVLVCGGSESSNKEKIFAILDAYHEHWAITMIVQGDNEKTNTITKQWAQINKIPFIQSFYKTHKNYHKLGLDEKKIRTEQLYKQTQPHLIIAFEGGRKSENIIKQADKDNIPYILIE